MTATKTQEYTLGRWSLGDLFPAHDSKEMKVAIKQLEDQAAAIEKWREKLGNDISDKDFLALLQSLETSDRLMKASGQFEYYLRQIRNFKPYTLAEPEEKIINIKDVTGARSLQTLY